MEHRSDQYHHDLPPPPPAHQYQTQSSHSQDYAYENQQQQHQQRQAAQRQQSYQQSTSSSHGYSSPSQEYPTSPYSTQTPSTQNQQQQPPPPSSHSQAKSRSFSFHSDKSHKRTGSKTDNFHETPAEKEARRIHSKADPTLAISEAEPAVEAAMTQSSLAPLRSMQHRDNYGNPIADPDKSNPTRSRWERPLDTIRSFEAAIDGAYHRKSVIPPPPDTDPVANWNRRNSFHPGAPSRGRRDSYYSSRPVSFRPESTQFSLAHPSTARNSVYDYRGYNDEHNGGGGYGPPPGRYRPTRVQTEPHFGQQAHNPNVYHLSHKDRSYETVTSAEGSGNSDQFGYHTDPTSSDNSSIERRSPAKRQEPMNDHGIGFSQSGAQNLQLYGQGQQQQQQQYQMHQYQQQQQQQQQQQGPPPPTHGQAMQNGRPAVPRKEVGTLLRRQPPPQAQQQPQPAASEKRKSWFARRFSKNN